MAGAIIGLRLRLSERVFRLGRDLGRGAKKLPESFAGGLPCSLLEKIGRGFQMKTYFKMSPTAEMGITLIAVFEVKKEIGVRRRI
ncbi:MAG: hypothetical protein ABR920_18460 [Terriglobales bacterium]